MNKVCAVIVSYNDFENLKDTLNAVEMQVDKIVIVDNGSEDEIVNFINQLCLFNEKIILISLKENLGIAVALNKGVHLAEKEGYDYVLTLDQDSKCSEGLVLKLLSGFDLDRKIAIVSPKIAYEKMKNNLIIQEKFEFKDYIITSGNLIKIDVFNKIGYFEEKLFIDSVDFDFCLRIINKGFLICIRNDAFLFHKLGNPREIKVFGLLKYYYTEHSSVRNYYIFRNTVFLLKKYFKSNTLFCFKKMIITSKLFFENIFFHYQKKEVIKYMFMGLKDGFNGKYGGYSNDK
ncbi:glycosyltransferase family 2 protein [Carnobacterium maltaromaticum]|uniref:glycosyltransferase family 2 protein n=1 Tax=Carnobacterium maltaromaticum TaxID=2751 RepID=UPI00070498D4|nr:glycosyltransferase family 2 protein [Carnobacterium maltaromaticum]